MPLLLTIQTATPAGSLALSDGDQLLVEASFDLPRTPTDWLLPALDDMLGRAKIERARIDGVVVVRGPGSFTGLRVGLASAKGLALGLGVPMVGVSSLQTLAMQLPHPAMPVCAMLDARKKEVYTALYSWQGGQPRPLSAERVCAPEALLAELDEDTLFIGSGAMVYRTLIVRELGERAHFAPDFLNLPRAAAAAALAGPLWASAETLSAETLMPVYLRLSEAELNQPQLS
jgi:tRNA threonylcarbamoyladenosine biosynthesis protein TsaB